MTALYFILALLLAGCSVIASKEATVACQVADTATSLYAVNHGAVERGILLHGAGAGGILGFGAAWLAVKLVFHDEIGETGNATLNVIACAAGAHNANVIRKL